MQRAREERIPAIKTGYSRTSKEHAYQRLLRNHRLPHRIGGDDDDDRRDTELLPNLLLSSLRECWRSTCTRCPALARHGGRSYQAGCSIWGGLGGRRSLYSSLRAASKLETEQSWHPLLPGDINLEDGDRTITSDIRAYALSTVLVSKRYVPTDSNARGASMSPSETHSRSSEALSSTPHASK
jgi:hypothetical protein